MGFLKRISYVILVFSLSTGAWAIDHVWSDLTGTDYFNNGSWSPGGVPTLGNDCAIFGLNSTFGVVQVNGDTIVGGWWLRDTQPAAVTITGAGTEVILAPGGGCTLPDPVGGGFQMDAGILTIDSGASLFVGAAARVTGGNLDGASGRFELRGTGSHNVQLDAAANIGLNLDITNGGSYNVVTGFFIDSGSFTITNGSLNTGGESMNVPSFNLDGGTFFGDSSVVGVGGNITLASGTFNAQGASINISGSFTNNGATFNRGTSRVTFTLNGTSVIGGTTSTIFNDLYNNSGNVLRVDRNTTVNGLFRNLGDVILNANLTTNGNTDIQDLVTINDNRTMVINGGINAGSSGAIGVAGANSVLDLNSSATTIPSGLSVDLSGTLDLAGVSGSYTNNGTIGISPGAKIQGITHGIINGNPLPFKVGLHSLTWTVTDAGLNLNGSAIDQVTVTVTSSVTGDSEDLVLCETGNATGTFSAVSNGACTTSNLATHAVNGAGNNNGTLYHNDDGNIVISFTDPHDATDTGSNNIMAYASTKWRASTCNTGNWNNAGCWTAGEPVANFGIGVDWSGFSGTAEIIVTPGAVGSFMLIPDGGSNILRLTMSNSITLSETLTVEGRLGIVGGQRFRIDGGDVTVVNASSRLGMNNGYIAITNGGFISAQTAGCGLTGTSLIQFGDTDGGSHNIQQACPVPRIDFTGGNTATFTLQSNLTAGSFDFGGGTLNLGSHILEITGSQLDITGGTVNADTSTLRFNSANTLSLPNQTWHNIIIDGATVSPVVGPSISLTGSMTINSGSYTATTQTHSVAGSWRATGTGSFSFTTGAVTFATGSGSHTIRSNGASFHDLYISSAPAATFTIEDTLNVTGDLAVNNGTLSTIFASTYQPVQVAGTLSTSVGTLTLGDASGGSTVNVGSINFTGGTLNNRNSTIITGGTSTINSSLPFFNLQIGSVGSFTTFNSAITIQNQLSFATNSQLNQNNQALTLVNNANSTTSQPLNLSTPPQNWVNEGTVTYQFSKDSNGLVTARSYTNLLVVEIADGLSAAATGPITVTNNFTTKSLATNPTTVPQFHTNNASLTAASITVGNPNQHAALFTGTGNVTANGFSILSTGSYFSAVSGTWAIDANWANFSTSSSFDWGSVSLVLNGINSPTTINNGSGNNADFPDTVFQGSNSFDIITNDLRFRSNASLTISRPITRTANIIFPGNINNITQNIDINNAPVPTTPQVNGQTGAPVTIPFATPTISWSFTDGDIIAGSPDTQGAYRLCIGTSAVDDAFSNCDQFDSGKVISTSNSVVYSGPALGDSTTYHYRVRVWDQLNTTSTSTATSTTTNATFEIVPPALAGADGAAKPAATRILPNATDLVVHQFTLSEQGADPNDVTLNEVTFNQAGTASVNTIANIHIYADDGTTANSYDGGDTLLGTLNSPATASMTIDTSGAGFMIGNGATETFWLVVDLNNNANFDETYQFSFQNATGVQNSVSVGSTSGSSSQSNTFTVQWASLAIADTPNAYPDSNLSIGQDDTGSVLKFSLTETSGILGQDVAINQISIANTGGAREDLAIQNAYLFEYPAVQLSPVIAAGSITTDDQTLVFNLSSTLTVSAGQTRHFYVRYQAQVPNDSVVGGSVFQAQVGAANIPVGDAPTVTGTAINVSGSATGRSVVIAKPQLELSRDTLTGNDAILVVDAPTALRPVYALNIRETTGTLSATINSITFQKPVKNGSWAGEDFDSLQLPASDPEVFLYRDTNSSGSFEPGTDQLAFGAGSGLDIAEAPTSYTFNGTAISISPGQTAKFFLVLQVQAATTPFFTDSANYRLQFSCASPSNVCVNANTGTPGTSDVAPDLDTSMSNPPDTITFVQGLVDGQVITDPEINPAVPGGSENNKVLRFRLTNNTPGGVAVDLTGITWDITPNNNSIIERVRLLDASGNQLGESTQLNAFAASFASRSLAGGASEDFFIAIDLTPEAPTGTAIEVEITSAQGAFSSNVGFPIIKSDISVARELSQSIEVRNNYPNFAQNEFALILFQGTGDNAADVKIYSLSGEVIRDYGKKTYSANVNQLRWYGETDKGDQAPFGVYFVRIETSSYQAFKRIFVRK